jgi:hypothetical protein
VGHQGEIAGLGDTVDVAEHYVGDAEALIRDHDTGATARDGTVP